MLECIFIISTKYMYLDIIILCCSTPRIQVVKKILITIPLSTWPLIYNATYFQMHMFA
jgi:hypothetical protein